MFLPVTGVTLRFTKLSWNKMAYSYLTGSPSLRTTTRPNSPAKHPRKELVSVEVRAPRKSFLPVRLFQILPRCFRPVRGSIHRNYRVVFPHSQLPLLL